MQTATPQEVIQRVLQGEMSENDHLLSVLYNRNLDLSQAAGFWVGYLNDSWAPQINAKLEEGFQVFRIQTEFQGAIGHSTMIYMAKMKTS